MTALFWALEYGKVHIAYMILVFVWPSLVFHKLLKGKSLTFRFGFCATASVLVLNTVVLLLGLVGLLRPWVFRLLFYGSVTVSAYFAIPDKKAALKQAGRVILGTYGLKQLGYTAYSAVMKRVKNGIRKIWDSIDGRRGEYVLLGLVLLYGMIYFTYGAFQDYSYGFGDMYPHNAWIYGLTQGQVFSAGVYPEGMHCFIYSMHVLFGIRIYSCMLFTAGVHILIFLLSAYCLLKEVFRSQYTPIVALALFLTMDLVCIDEIYSMSRLQWTIPQEFGLYTVLLCGAFLVRYLRTPWRDIEFLDSTYYSTLRKLHKLIFNEELLVFMMALSVSLIIHFYPTIMAFFLCLAFVPMAIRKILDPKRLIPLALAVTAGCLIAILPMCLALASGIPFQGSIGWAVNVMNGTDGQGQGAIVIDETTGEEITIFNKKPDKNTKPENTQQNNTQQNNTQQPEGTENAQPDSTRQPDGTEDVQSDDGAEQPEGAENTEDTQPGDGAEQPEGAEDTEEVQPDDGAEAPEGAEDTQSEEMEPPEETETMQSGGTIGTQETPSVEEQAPESEPAPAPKEPFTVKRLFERIGDKLRTIYWGAYVTLYRRERATLLMVMTVVALILFAACRIGIMIYTRVSGAKMRCDAFDGYLALTLSSIFFMTMYAAPGIGLPALIAGSRLCSTSQLLLIGMCMIPLDLVLYILGLMMRSSMMTKVSWGCVAAVYAGTMLTGCYHGYLYFELTRYNGAVMTTQAITRTLPKYSYTIVSTVDELYHMIQYGFHEEAVKFVNEVVDNDYTLPSEYVFIYVEKHPIEYAQSHFFGGPKWLAWEKYPAYYDSFVSQCPRINNATIAPELAEPPFYQYPISSKAYSELLSRLVVESRLQKWCDEFERLYPNEMRVYYEDENFICYYFKQNPACLYQLGIQ